MADSCCLRIIDQTSSPVVTSLSRSRHRNIPPFPTWGTSAETVMLDTLDSPTAHRICHVTLEITPLSTVREGRIMLHHPQHTPPGALSIIPLACWCCNLLSHPRRAFALYPWRGCTLPSTTEEKMAIGGRGGVCRNALLSSHSYQQVAQHVGN